MRDRAELIKLGAFWGIHYIHHLHMGLNIGDSEQILGERSTSFFICAINGVEMIQKCDSEKLHQHKMLYS
jgi:hypothetical protein